MGAIQFSGKHAEQLLSKITCSSTTKGKKGIMSYSMILSEDGGILDDVMMGMVADNRWIMVVNASNKSKVLKWIAAHNDAQVDVKMLDSFAMIALQGPAALSILGQTFPALAVPSRFGILSCTLKNQEGFILRTGYTGEDGVELILPETIATEVAKNLLENQATPCGLASRDSLRIESGLPLYGHELNESLTPLNTRYPWVVNWKGEFIGKAALEKQRLEAINTVTVGIRCNTKQIARQGTPIVEGGVITSGTLPPGADQSIAMALVPSHLQAIGTELSVQFRNAVVTATVVSTPFNQ